MPRDYGRACVGLETALGRRVRCGERLGHPGRFLGRSVVLSLAICFSRRREGIGFRLHVRFNRKLIRAWITQAQHYRPQRNAIADTDLLLINDRDIV